MKGLSSDTQPNENLGDAGSIWPVGSRTKARRILAN